MTRLVHFACTFVALLRLPCARVDGGRNDPVRGWERVKIAAKSAWFFAFESPAC